jgi:hypothetical protein
LDNFFVFAEGGVMDAIWSVLADIGRALLVPIAGAVGVGMAFLIGQKIKLQSLKINGDTWATVQAICKTAVQSAQQQLYGGTNAAKKAFAVEFATARLKARNIKFDADLVSDMIEAQVWDVKYASTLLDLPPTPSLLDGTRDGLG